MSEQDRRAPVSRAAKRERFSSADRLQSRADYQHCYQAGRRFNGVFHTLHFVSNEMARPRLGITASRKVGGAVVRHGLKRQVREAFRRFVGRERLPAMDLVVHLKPAAASSLSNELRGEIQQALQRLVDRTGRVG